MFHAEYSAGSPLRMLVDLRNVVDAALARSLTGKKTVSAKPSEPPALRARAAAAGAPFASRQCQFQRSRVRSKRIS